MASIDDLGQRHDEILEQVLVIREGPLGHRLQPLQELVEQGERIVVFNAEQIDLGAQRLAHARQRILVEGFENVGERRLRAIAPPRARLRRISLCGFLGNARAPRGKVA